MRNFSANHADREKINARVEWLDFIRSLAIMAVVVCHTVENVFYNDIYRMESPSFVVRLFALSVHAVGRIGVPLFLFLTGYLLLDRKYDTASDVFRFWKTKLMPLIVAYELWLLIYQSYDVFFLKAAFDMQVFIRRMFFLLPINWSHMWYMPMIVGIYLMLPLVSFLLRAFPSKLFLIPALICFCYCFVFPSFNKIFPAYDIPLYQTTLSTEFTGNVYGFYLICGYFIKKFIVRIQCTLSVKRLNVLIACLFSLSAISFAVTVAFQMLCFSKDTYYDLWYNFPLLLISALCFFCGVGLLFFDHKIPLLKMWNKISVSSLGIYFIHNVVLRTFNKSTLFSVYAIPRYVKLMIFFVICFALSFLICELIAHIPYASQLLLLRKRRSESKQANKIYL